MMTRKDFVAVAAALAQLPDYQARRAAALALVGHFRASNPAFDSVRFLTACKARDEASTGRVQGAQQ